MRELHLRLRSLSLENSTCPDSERYPFLKELITLDKKLHANWEAYDHYIVESGESKVKRKAANMTLKLLAFITQVIERTYLADNHNKILLGRSEKSNTFNVITSQNLTRGNRHESAFISTSPEIFANLHAQVNDLITNHSVPLHDLFRERIAAD